MHLGKKAGDKESQRIVETAAPSQGDENYFLGEICIYCPVEQGHMLRLCHND